ncbi:putative beta-lysine N-acetyltransferase [Neobacillus sp. SM06]|uniref:putative beta-lysine N-acetyltransferase n=1 Tax=Neobacillus sp. SM06 TaxID=3422492 RepID=UPI003D2909E7
MDPFNKRMRIDDYRGNLTDLIKAADNLAERMAAEKIILKGRSEHLVDFIEKGFQLEAIVDHYFLGSNAYFLTNYRSAERRKSENWIAEDAIIRGIYERKETDKASFPPKEYELKKAGEDVADELANLYRHVFPIYPTPLHDPEYVRKTMKEGTIYYAYFYNGKIVSAASAEVHSFYKNAELTDCATLQAHRKHGLMKWILKELEKELRKQNIYCAYSLARALSFGMNAALFQLGYNYRGRLINNCYIYDKLENMNAWVKNLADC